MRALITGVGGFVGRHLARHLLAEGDAVGGIALPTGDTRIEGVEVFPVDLCDRPRVDEVVRRWRPEAIFHLAAQSSSTESLADPWATIGNNLRGQMNLFEAVIAAGTSPRILVIGSSEEYGRLRPDEIPTHEDVPLRPVTPYAVSKVGQDVMGFQYFAQYGLPIVRVRPFSHTGPGHDARFVVPSFAKQVAEIERGTRPAQMSVGDLDVYRDFTDARDMVQAYRLAVLEGEPGEVYNLGRGSAVRIADVLTELLTMVAIEIEVHVDRERLRASDVPRQQADISRFQARTGWQPGIPWETTLRDTLNYWRQQVAEATVEAANAYRL